MTTIPSITPLPTPVPTIEDPANFDARADAFLAALPSLGNQVNATVAVMNIVTGEVQGLANDVAEDALTAAAAASAAVGVSTYMATSTSPHSATAGTKTFGGLEAARSFKSDDAIVAIRRSDATVRLYGKVDVGGYNAGANTLAATFTSSTGTGGPFSDWIVIHAALEELSVATAAEVLAYASTLKAVTPAAIIGALAEVTLFQNGGTIVTGSAAGTTLDLEKFAGAVVNLAANAVLPNPVNHKVGLTGRIRFVQPGSGSLYSLSLGTYWKRQGGPTSLTAVFGANDILEFEVITPTFILYDIIKNPS